MQDRGLLVDLRPRRIEVHGHRADGRHLDQAVPVDVGDHPFRRAGPVGHLPRFVAGVELVGDGRVSLSHQFGRPVAHRGEVSANRTGCSQQSSTPSAHRQQIVDPLTASA
jgi:hypothetical protein